MAVNHADPSEEVGEWTLTTDVVSEGDEIRGSSGDAVIEGRVTNLQLIEQGEKILRVTLDTKQVITPGVISHVNGKRVVRPLSLGLSDSWHMKACPMCGESGGVLMDSGEYDFGLRECESCGTLFDITKRCTEPYFLEDGQE